MKIQYILQNNIILYKLRAHKSSKNSKKVNKLSIICLILLGNVACIAPGYAIKVDAMKEEIGEIYRTHLGRDPDPDGLKHWVKVFKRKGPKEVENGIANSPEAHSRRINQCNQATKSLKETGEALDTCNTNLQATLKNQQNDQKICAEENQNLEEKVNTCGNDKAQCIEDNKSLTENYNAKSLDLTWWKNSFEMAYTSAKLGFYSSISTELIKDGFKLAGCSEERATTVATAATFIKGLATTYVAESYASTLSEVLLPSLAGTVVSSGLTYCGVSAEKSVTAGSAAALLTSFAHSWFYNPETFVDHAFAVGGYWFGSTLGIQAHDMALDLFSLAKDSFYSMEILGGPDDYPDDYPDDADRYNTPALDSDDDSEDSTDDSDVNSSSSTQTLTLAEALDHLLPQLVQLRSIPQNHAYFSESEEEFQSAMQVSKQLKIALAGVFQLENLTGKLEKFIVQNKNHSALEKKPSAYILELIDDLNLRAGILISKMNIS
jgi:hypothetical protein